MGMRPGEWLSTRTENIDINERFLDTGMEIDAMKSTRISNTSLLFFLPRGFIPYLEKYLLSLNQEKGWVFPNRKNKGDHLKYAGIYNYVKMNYGDKWVWFRKFRKGCDLL